MVASQLLGLSRMDIPVMLGTMVVEDLDKARVVGLLIHLFNGQVFALLYAAAFALIGWSTWWLGALFGLVHGFAALTVIIPFLPGIHPRMASERSGPELTTMLEPPGPLGSNYGRETLAFTLVAHVAYGSILGGFLNPR